MTDDPVREYLEEQGCPEHVVEAGLDGLLEKWEYAVEDVEQGYPLGFDDYLDDMDGRELIKGALAVAAPAARQPALVPLRAADARMKAAVLPAGCCLWGEDTAREKGWTAKENWWYFSIPREPGPELKEDIESRL